MAYFLKKSNLKKGVYLQIYESFYNPEKKGTSHKSYKAIGYVEELKASGIDDPVEYYTAVVKDMNLEANKQKEQDRVKVISSSPERYLGYFLLKSIYDQLGVSPFLNLLQAIRGFRFSLSELLESLIYSRVISPCSKRRTLNDVIPKLYQDYQFSYDQVLEGVNFLGSEYEKIVEIFNHQVRDIFGFNTDISYFDCTNFYFEIDKEDLFRKKGPSKENKRDPIVGLGLLLDANQVPMSMKMFPGNESEKPVIREVIQSLKDRNQITGRTIRVADKGLNCTENIVSALKENDGYIFSKSVKMLPEKEKTWVLLNNDYHNITDKKGNLLYKIKECVDDFPYKYTDETGKTRNITLREKRVVTYNPKLAEKKHFEIAKQVEKAHILKACEAKHQEYGDSSKYVTFSPADKKGKVTDGKVTVTINEDAIEKDMQLSGYNMIITSELNMSADEIYSTYHNLWRIEESFRLMKSYLDARPVFLQREESIKGHFLICYIAVLLIRLLQFKALDNQYCTEELVRFMKDFRVVEVNKKEYINLTTSTPFIRELTQLLHLPLTNYFLDNTQIKKMLNHRF